MDSINCSVHRAFKAQLEFLEKMLPIWKVWVIWLTQRCFADSLSGRETIHTLRRQSPKMQTFVGSSQWWDQEYHTAPSNVQQTSQNLMQCNSVVELSPISPPVLLSSLKISWHCNSAWIQNTTIQIVTFHNKASNEWIYLIKCVMKLEYAQVHPL